MADNIQLNLGSGGDLLAWAQWGDHSHPSWFGGLRLSTLAKQRHRCVLLSGIN